MRWPTKSLLGWCANKRHMPSPKSFFLGSQKKRYMYGTVWIHWIKNKQKPILGLIYIVFMSRRITMTGTHLWLIIDTHVGSLNRDRRTDRQTEQWGGLNEEPIETSRPPTHLVLMMSAMCRWPVATSSRPHLHTSNQLLLLYITPASYWTVGFLH